MNNFLSGIKKSLTGGVMAFWHYPVSMICAVLVAVIGSIFVERSNVFDYRFLRSMMFALVFGAVLHMAVSAVIQKFELDIKFRGLLYGFGVIAAAIAFSFLYFPSGEWHMATVSRIIAGGVIAMLVFLVVPSYKNERVDFNQTLFMNLKCYFIAIIYGLVIMLGLFFVCFAVQSLIWKEMSQNFYSHIAIWSWFLAYAFFLGHFPSFRSDEEEEKVEKAIRQPKFIEVLLGYILIPIILVLSLVLLVWAARIVVLGALPAFGLVAGIFTAYSLGGILIYFLVSHYETAIAKFYRRVFPITALLFLGFEGFNIGNRIVAFGLKTDTYFFSIVWLFSVVAVLLFVFIKVRKNYIVAFVAMGLAVFCVLPVVGFIDLPQQMQVMRLERVLVKNKMLVSGKLVPNAKVSEADKRTVTDAAYFLVNEKDGKLPKWLPRDINQYDKFSKVFGFSEIYLDNNYNNEPKGVPEYLANVVLGAEAIDISGYQYFVNINNIYDVNETKTTTVTGKKAKYEIQYLVDNYSENAPKIIVSRGDKEIIKKDLNDFFIAIYNKYKKPMETTKGESILPVSDMVFKAEADGVKIMLVFSTIRINGQQSSGGKMYMNSTLKGIYLGE